VLESFLEQAQRAGAVAAIEGDGSFALAVDGPGGILHGLGVDASSVKERLGTDVAILVGRRGECTCDPDRGVGILYRWLPETQPDARKAPTAEGVALVGRESLSEVSKSARARRGASAKW
jgi:hypothetical protein